MNNPNMGEGQAISVADLLKEKVQEVADIKENERQKEEKQKLADQQIIDDKHTDSLEEAMDKVDEKREEINNLSQKRDGLTDSQSKLDEISGGIKEKVLSFRETRNGLIDQYNEALKDENTKEAMELMGISSAKDFIKVIFDDGSTTEAKRLKDLTDDIKKSAGFRKGEEENVKEKFGLDGKGKILDGQIEDKNKAFQNEINELKMETPEGRQEVKSEALNRAKEKLEKILKKERGGQPPLSFYWEQGLQGGRRVDLKNLVSIDSDINEEAKILGISEPDLWKKLYLDRINEVLKDNPESRYVDNFKHYVQGALDYQLLDRESRILYNEADLKSEMEKQDLCSSTAKEFRSLQLKTKENLDLVEDDGVLKVVTNSGFKGQLNIYDDKEEKANLYLSEVQERLNSRSLLDFSGKKQDHDDIKNIKQELGNFQEMKRKLEVKVNESEINNKDCVDEVQKVIDKIGLTPEEVKEFFEYMRTENKSYVGSEYGSKQMIKTSLIFDLFSIKGIKGESDSMRKYKELKQQQRNIELQFSR